jgi:WD40 repeat protein
MRRVFLSYGHDQHADLATRLKEDLEQAGLPTWFDVERLKPGGDWERYIEEGIEWVSETPGEGRFVLLMTPHSVRRPDGYCLNELARALERELPVIPVMVSWSSPPLSIARLQWLDMRDVQEADEAIYQSRLDRLKAAILEDDLDFEAVQSRLIQRLKPLSFQAEIGTHLVDFTGRKWVEDDINAWLVDEKGDRIFWITAPPGAGKTALSVWLTTRLPELAGIHFCRHGRSRKGDARRAVTSLAYQLSTHLPDYRDRLNSLQLDSILAESDAGTLFDELFSQPLTGLVPIDGGPLILLIDALDEATKDGFNELIQVLAAEVQRTPPWLRLILTSRPEEPAVSLPLQAYEPYRLEEGGQYVADLNRYLERTLSRHTQEDALPGLVDRILTRSQGSFLYAKWVSLELARGRLNLDDPDAFPQGLGGIYLQFFERQFPDLQEYAARQRPVLEAMVAAREALPVDELAEILGWSNYDRDEVPESFGSLITIRDGRVNAFHLSALEWVDDRTRAGRYAVLASEGNRRLAEYCWTQVERNSALLPVYALRHAVSHLLEIGRYEDAGYLLLNFEYLLQRSRAGLQNLLSDFEDAGSRVQDADLAMALDAVRSVLLLAFPVLLRDPDQLASQLQARLLVEDHPAIRELVEQGVALAKAPLLLAATPALRQAGHPLTRILRGAAIGDDDPDLFALSAIALDDSRDVAMAVNEDGMFHLWDLKTGLLERREQLGEGFGCGALASGGKRWVLGGWDGSLVIIDPTEAEMVLFRQPGQGSLNAVALAPDESCIASGHSYAYGRRGALRLWRTDDLNPLDAVEVPEGKVSSVAFSPDGKTLAWVVTRETDGDQRESELRFSPAAHPATVDSVITMAGRIGALCYSPSGETLAVGCGDGRIELISTADHEERRVLAGHPIFIYSTDVVGLAFLPGGHHLVSAGWDGAIRQWDLRTAAEVAGCPTDSKVFSLDIGEAGRWAITGHKSGGARIWDLDRMAGLPQLARHASGAHLAPLADLGLVVSAGPDPDGCSLRLWGLDSGELLDAVRVTGSALALVTSPDEKLIQLVDEAGLSTWRVSLDPGPAIVSLQDAVPLKPAPDWIWEVAAAPGVVIGWESGYPNGRLLAWRHPWRKARELMQGKAYSPRLAISTDSSKCALLDDNGMLTVFDLQSDQLTKVATGLEGEFQIMALSASGMLATVANERGEVRLVRLPNGQVVRVRSGNGDWVSTLAFADDEHRLVIGTQGGRLEVWSLAEPKLEMLFCSNDSWSSVWASVGGEQIVASDGLGSLHFLRRA